MPGKKISISDGESSTDEKSTDSNMSKKLICKKKKSESKTKSLCKRTNTSFIKKIEDETMISGGEVLSLLQKEAETQPNVNPKIEENPIPLCHNIVSTSQIISSMREIDLQRLASLFPFTSYDRKRFAAITIRLANPHCTCLLFGSGKLVITGSTSFHACIVASQTITEMLREVNPR